MSQLNNVTFIIKTFNREKCLVKLLDSIRFFYPKVPVIVVDDGEKELSLGFDSYTNYIKTDFNIGLSAGRNIALQNTTTKYFLLLDDDYIFYKKTKIELLIEKLEKHNFDIIAGKWMQHCIVRGYEYVSSIENETLFLDNKPRSITEDGVWSVDVVLNFFVGKTKQVLKENPWYEELKLVEHTDFFLSAKLKRFKVGCYPKVLIKHKPVRNKEYNIFRKKVKAYIDLVQNKWNFNKVEYLNTGKFQRLRAKVLSFYDSIMVRFN